MNTALINYCLSNDPVTRGIYLGCYPADLIPHSENISFPYCVVVNEDASDGGGGTHWVTLFAWSRKEIDYFDSYARSPVPEIAAYLSQFERVNVNNKCLQLGVSSVCGQYCLYVLVQQCKHKHLFTIIASLIGKRNRDTFVQCFVNLRYSLDLPLIDLRHLLK
jgi:hypothetical protein